MPSSVFTATVRLASSKAGPIAGALPAIVITDSIVAIIASAAAFHEEINTTAAAIAFQVFGFCTMGSPSSHSPNWHQVETPARRRLRLPSDETPSTRSVQTQPSAPDSKATSCVTRRSSMGRPRRPRSRRAAPRRSACLPPPSTWQDGHCRTPPRAPGRPPPNG